MKDSSKTKAQLIAELREARVRLEGKPDICGELCQNVTGMLDYVSDCYAVVRPDGSIVKEESKLPGGDSEVDSRQNVEEWIAFKDHEKLKSSLNAVFSTGYPTICELRPFKKRGEESKQYSVRFVPHAIDGIVSKVMMVCTDISDLRRAEKSKREMKQSLDSLFHASPDAIVFCDVNGIVLDCNNATFKLMNTTERSNVIGVDGFSLIRDKEYRNEIKVALSNSFQADAVHLEELSFVDYSGNKKYVLVSCNATRDDNDRQSGIICVVKEITQRKNAEAEKKQIREQLITAARMASVGTLASGVAHELNNPLAAIMGFAQLITLGGDDHDKIKDRAQKIYNASLRMRDIIEHLRAFAKDGTKSESVEMCVNDAVKDSLILLSAQLENRGVDLSLNLATGLPKISGDRTQLESVFQNLITNSRDAFETVDDGRQKKIGILSTLNDNGVLEVVYDDNAGGMEEDVIKQVLDPFFTTKTVGKGTGLGMSVSYGIIENHGGQISIESQHGKGSRFTIQFPVQ